MMAVCLITACQFGVSHSKHVVFWDFLEYFNAQVTLKSFSKPKSSIQCQDFVSYEAPRTILIVFAKKLNNRVKSFKHRGLKMKSNVASDSFNRL